ncbi:hypothetical protein [Falsihalocynthiibacter arcticus]|uniref:Flagellar FliJ protein n=1 Tax=Falsihalocynthiibacter arcticus TaxID=1579316 RepID=A0A126UY73_9RHOB|nr:hypothetical protein [Falsihalocynthiibacter arcticus]AML51022.1 hypothetical protein RC74_06805 [Falsihalocynthiibacter arcticus]
MDKRLKNLKNLSATLLDIELFKLKKISADQQRLSDEILRIRESKGQQAVTLTEANGMDPSLLAGAFSKWEEWCTQKSMSLNQEQAVLRVEMEKQRKKTQAMFGRSEAVKELMKRDTNMAKKKMSL